VQREGDAASIRRPDARVAACFRVHCVTSFRITQRSPSLVSELHTLTFHYADGVYLEPLMLSSEISAAYRRPVLMKLIQSESATHGLEYSSTTRTARQRRTLFLNHPVNLGNRASTTEAEMMGSSLPFG
jgi:hypothetical protein